MPIRKKVIKIKNQDIKKEDFLKQIDKIYFINLEERKDRLESIQKELRKIDPQLLKTERINAVKKDRGAIGCGLSHIKALEDALEKKYKRVILLEDDFVFVKDKEDINLSLNYLFQNFSDFNICLLAGNINSCRRLNNKIAECLNVQTTSGYIISQEFIPLLLNNFKEAVKIMENNYRYGQAEIDQTWKKLQGKDKKFYIFNPKLGKQLNGYSDIEKRNVKYNC